MYPQSYEGKAFPLNRNDLMKTRLSLHYFDKLGMKILILTILCLNSVISLQAKERKTWLIDKDIYQFRGQEKSLIDWEHIDTEQWMSYPQWLADRHMKDKNPGWRINHREMNLKENVGRVISCIGECKVYRGAGSFIASYRTLVKEGDEFFTELNSYAWIFLFDGTLVRVSPKSSISFKELNIGKLKNFLHARVNHGNILWIGRTDSEVKETELSETDRIFLPLQLAEANIQFYENLSSKTKTEQDFIEEMVMRPNENISHIKRVNKFIMKNNEFAKNKPSLHFIVFPNMTLKGESLSFRAFHDVGQQTFFQMLSGKEWFSDPVKTEVTAFYRGFNNTQSWSPEPDKWYEISRDGKESDEFSIGGDRLFSEMVTKRIASIFYVREDFLKKYSKFAFNMEIDKRSLGREYGYRLWERKKYKSGKTDIDYRVEYLQEMTRRLETSNLFQGKKVLEYLKENGEYKKLSIYDEKFYKLAWVRYLNSLSKGNLIPLEDRININRWGFRVWLLKNAQGNRYARIKK